MRRIAYVVVGLLLWMLPLGAGAAERLALVIGNAQYQNLSSLVNTTNDARAIADTLTVIGFEVTTLIDAPYADLRATLDDFAFRAETAEIALIYYAGHGVEVQGENFLVPVDVSATSNVDIQRQSVSLKELLQTVDRARKMRIVILDSCRDNPFGDGLAPVTADATTASTEATRSSGSGGLAPASPDRGTLVAYAARDGAVSFDGLGKNSPFATALMEKMTQPGLEIGLMFREVRDSVLKQTGNLQEPHVYGSLTGVPFFLAGAGQADSEKLSSADLAVAWAEVPVDQKLLLEKQAAEGDTRSLFGLAKMRMNPLDDNFDMAAAVGFLEKAAAAGSPEAQYELGQLYERGTGVAKDDARALELYTAAADQEFSDAVNDLGFLHYQGALGLTPDPVKALTFFERAADLRNPQAMYNYAALIDDGLVAGKGAEDAGRYLYDALRTGAPNVLKVLSEHSETFSADTRKALQGKLSEYKFYDGAIDGDFGPGTQRSIRKAFGLTE